MTPRDQLLAEWYKLKQEIEANKALMKPILDREMELRRFLMNDIWGDQLREGTNNYDAGGGYLLKGNYKIDRKVIEEQMGPVKEELLRRQISPDNIFSWTPGLKLKNYRELKEEDRKVVDYCLDIKPASPTLELILPKSQ